MTVPEPTPDRAARAPFLRRVCFAATTVALTGAFALTLSGIASTEGSVRPGGQAAAIAAAQQRSTDAADAIGRHHCRRGDGASRARTGAGRV
jgi:hypothetical protein